MSARFVSVADVGKTSGVPGTATTLILPCRARNVSCYTQGVHGFSGGTGADASLKVDTPSSLRRFDARTGELVAETVIEPSGPEFVPREIDRDAFERIAEAQDTLVPHFFDGASSVPPHLEHVAAAYRDDFRRTAEPGHMVFYRTHAGDWLQWVGLGGP